MMHLMTATILLIQFMKMKNKDLTISSNRKMAVIFEDNNVQSNSNSIPVECALKQNYPNPFNPSTTISFSLPKGENIKIIIYDVTGNEVNVLLNEFRQAGNYEINFNSNTLSSGIYFYRILSGEFVQTKRMVLIK